MLGHLAWADHRALSVDVSGAWSGSSVSALQTTQPQATLSFGPSVWLGARYALTNNLELSATGLFDIPVVVAHNGVVLATDSGDFPGTLVHQTTRFGGLAGARAVFGLVLRVHLGLEVGWSQRLYTGLTMYDDRNPDAAIDYGLGLRDASVGQFVVSPLAGLEWAAGDHWSLAVLPRAQVMLGARQVDWAVLIPLQFSWSWYL
jgi:hypothetical protein